MNNKCHSCKKGGLKEVGFLKEVAIQKDRRFYCKECLTKDEDISECPECKIHYIHKFSGLTICNACSAKIKNEELDRKFEIKQKEVDRRLKKENTCPKCGEATKIWEKTGKRICKNYVPKWMTRSRKKNKCDWIEGK